MSIPDYILQRPSAPTQPPSEILVDDNQVITELNHPLNMNPRFGSLLRFRPSFIGKTWGTMKEMEKNRAYKTSEFIDQHINTISSYIDNAYNFYDFNPEINLSVNARIQSWKSNSNNISLNLSDVIFHNTKTDNENDNNNLLSVSLPDENIIADLPPDINSIVFFSSTTIPESLANYTSLISLYVYTDYLPVMKHIEYLEWNITSPFDDVFVFDFDFSEWTSLRELRLHGITETSKIKLPPNLVYLTLEVSQINLDFDSPISSKDFEDVFEDFEYNTLVFKSLKYLSVSGILWTHFPVLDECQCLIISFCNNIQTIEAPKCRSLTVAFCNSFIGCGPEMLRHNNSLDHICFMCLKKSSFYHIPVGSPNGFRAIDIFDTSVVALPTKFAPHAHISLYNAGSHLFVNSRQARENMVFYFDHHNVSNNLHLFLKQNESLEDMVDRIYGFNWPKFITKIQRQYRFKKYIKNTYSLLDKCIPKQVSISEVATLLGATQTFKKKKEIFFF